MAEYFLRSGGGGAGTAASPFATFAQMFTGLSAGDVCFASDLFAELAAATTYTVPGTVASPITVIGIEDWGAEEDPGEISYVESAGAYWESNNATQFFNGGAANWKNISFRLSGASSRTIYWRAAAGGNTRHVFSDCTFQFTGTGAADWEFGFYNGNEHSFRAVLNRCDFSFGIATQRLKVSGDFEWLGGSVGGTVPDILFVPSDYRTHPRIRVADLDLSALGAGKSLVNVTPASQWLVDIRNCRLGANVTVASGSFVSDAARIQMIRSDSGATNYRTETHQLRGITYPEDTNINNDSAAATGLRLVSNANASYFTPLIADHVIRFNAETTDPITVTIPMMTDGVTLTDKDIWPVASYLGNASYPLGSLESKRADYFAAGTNWAADTSDWVETDITSAVKQKMAVTFSPKMTGPMQLAIHLARASTTVYLDRAALVT